MSADEMIASIRTNNLARLTLIPGVGKKTAERLVLELRDKIGPLSSTALEEEYAANDSGSRTISPHDAMQNDVLSALLNLGYQKAVAERAVTSAANDGGDLSVQSILRRSLKFLSKV
jgi:Holliday junction DNA helicase RuvA